MCNPQANSRYLKIAYSDFIASTNATFWTPYVFTLQVYKATDPDVNLALIPSTNISITWLQVQRPQFVMTYVG